MPKISILTITSRDLYLSEQVNSLQSQTFRDFEWVLVDSHYEDRRNRMLNLTGGLFLLTHIPDKKLPYYATSQAYNIGLMHSKGELIFFMSDYILPHPECLARHWEIHLKYPNALISGRSIKVDCSPFMLDARLQFTDRKIEAKDFRKPILRRKRKLEDDLYEVTQTESPTWWAGRNDSAPLEPMLECNGFEEELDGRWGGQDGEFVNRLFTYGLRYLYDSKSMCLEFEHISGQKESIRSHKEQLELAKALVKYRKENHIYKGNPNFNLKEERRKCLKV